MRSRWNRVLQWTMWAASGMVLLQTTSCDTTLNVIQTGLLGALTGITYFLARNV